MRNNKLRSLVWGLVKDSVDRDMETLSAEFAESINRLNQAHGLSKTQVEMLEETS